jgi:DNA-binding transcriptional ArsR family regulator
VKPILWRKAVRDSGLDPRAKLVAFTLSVYMNGAGECWPSKEALAENTGLGLRTVDRAILRLEAAGYLLIERRGGRHKTNRYSARNPVTLDALFGEKPRHWRRETPSETTRNPAKGDARSSPEIVQEVETASRPETAEQRRQRVELLRKSSGLLRDMPA